MLKDKEAYKKLPSQTSQQILRLVDKNWKSFFNSLKNWRARPRSYQSRPRPPKYKKKNGEFVLIFTNQQCRIKEGYLFFPEKAAITPIKTRIKSQLHQVRLVPKGLYYVVEIIYEKDVKNLKLDKKRILGIDLGLANIVTMVNNNLKLDKKRILGIDLGLANIVTMVNNIGLQPAIIKGGIAKSTNQFYNKQLARYKSIKDKRGIAFETRRIQKLTKKRNNKINDQFHKISRIIINYCVDNNLGTIIIGYNRSWKQKVNMGRINNQKFVQLPYFKLISQIQYKAKLVGIDVILEKESYTSKCSFLDNESIQKHNNYAGKRINRGLFRSKKGIILNADVNAGYNIIKKVVPNA
jgi:putative transposase